MSSASNTPRWKSIALFLAVTLLLTNLAQATSTGSFDNNVVAKSKTDDAMYATTPASTTTPVAEGRQEQNHPSSDEAETNASAAAAAAEDDPSAPMIYYTPHDYAARASAEKTHLLSRGEEAILHSEIPLHIPGPGRPGPHASPEDWAAYTQRYVATMNALIARGVSILNDQCTGDVVASRFGVGGRVWDLGEGRGVSRGEFEEFGRWFDEVARREEGGDGGFDVPEKWRKYEVPKEELEREEREEQRERRSCT